MGGKELTTGCKVGSYGILGQNKNNGGKTGENSTAPMVILCFRKLHYGYEKGNKATLCTIFITFL